MNKKIATIILLIIISVTMVSCSLFSNGASEGDSQNENLPNGVVSGVWIAEGYENHLGFIIFNDSFLSDFYGDTGQYSLVAENTISLTTQAFREEFVVKIEEPKKKITLAGDYLYTLDLVLEDTSSGKLEKDIIGTWNVYNSSCRGFWEDTQPEGAWTFERDGTFAMSMNDGYEPVEIDLTYVLVEDKVFIKALESETNSMTESFGTVHSLGNLLILETDGNRGSYYCLIKQ